MLKIADIVIDPDLKDCLRPLTEVERELLRESIRLHGMTEPLIVWKGSCVLVDGHHRVAIWRELFGQEQHDSPQILEMEFDNKAAVKRFIVEKQFGRRNLTAARRIEIAMALKPGLEALAKENQRAGGKGKGSTKLSNVNTRKSIAQAAGVSEGSIQKYVNVKASGDADTVSKMLNGDITIDAANRMVPQRNPRRITTTTNPALVAPAMGSKTAPESVAVHGPVSSPRAIFTADHFDPSKIRSANSDSPSVHAEIDVSWRRIGAAFCEFLNVCDRQKEAIDRVSARDAQAFEGRFSQLRKDAEQFGTTLLELVRAWAFQK